MVSKSCFSLPLPAEAQSDPSDQDILENVLYVASVTGIIPTRDVLSRLAADLRDRCRMAIDPGSLVALHKQQPRLINRIE
jgi:hypothetical protein